MPNIRLAFRALFRTPFVTTVAVASLALGIGANAAMFSLFDQVLLRPLPVPHPEDLVNLSAPGPKPGSSSCGRAGDCDAAFSYPMFRDLERSQTVFAGLAGHAPFGVSVVYGDRPVTGDGIYVSGAYFATLGVTPALGRLLTEADDQGVQSSFAAVLSYEFWRSQLGGAPDVLGRAITVNGRALTVVGVAGKGFEGTTLGVRPLVFAPIGLRATLSAGFRGFEDRRDYWVYLFARLKPGVTRLQAGVGLNGLYHSIIGDVELPLQAGMSDATLAQFREKRVVLEAGQRGQSSMHQEVRVPLLLLFGVTGIVLLIACANIANLLLARGAGRAGEMALRLALGASRRQLIAQLLTESLVLASLGGLAGLLVARWTLGGVASLLPAAATGGLVFTIPPGVWLFTGGLALTTGLVFGSFPAWHSTRNALVASVRDGGGRVSGTRTAARFRAGLVTIQISLATALLIGAGLFVRSLVNVTRVDLGVHVDSVLTFSIAPERAGYDSTRALQLYARVEDALGALPGVSGVTTALVPLLGGDSWGADVRVQGFPTGPDVDRSARFNHVGTSYFSTLGVRPVAGREFTDADRRGAALVAVVNQAFVKKFNLGSDAVGRYLWAGGPDTLSMQIVGVVPDVKYSDVKRAVPPLFYVPWRQDTHVPFLNFYVRASYPGAVLQAVRGVVRGIDPALPIEGLKTMPQQIRDNIFLDRLISILSSAFATLATLLAAVGLYGVLAYAVAQRTREIGIRMALGADAARVRGMVLRQVGGMTAIGGVLGLLSAAALGKAGNSLLYGLTAADPTVFVLALGALLVVALLSAYLPARRASRVDPIRALRYD